MTGLGHRESLEGLKTSPALLEAAKGPELAEAKTRTGERLKQARESHEQMRQVMEEFKASVAANPRLTDAEKSKAAEITDKILAGGVELPRGSGQVMMAFRHADPSSAPLVMKVLVDYEKAFRKLNAPIGGADANLDGVVTNVADKLGMDRRAFAQSIRESGASDAEQAGLVRVTEDLASWKIHMSALPEDATRLLEKFPKIAGAIRQGAESERGKESAEHDTRGRAIETILDSVE